MAKELKRRRTMVDLRAFPEALELARKLYRENGGNLRQTKECAQIAEFLGLSKIAVWHAYNRGDLGVPSPNPARAEAWAKGEREYDASHKPCSRCFGKLRMPGDDLCVACEMKNRAAVKSLRLAQLRGWSDN